MDEKLIKWWGERSEEQKANIIAFVEELKGSAPTLEEKHYSALRLLSDHDLAAVYKRNPAELTKIQAAIEAQKLKDEKETSYVFEIVPYQIEDESIAEIIRKGPDQLYPEWEEAMLDRAEARGIDEFIDRVQTWLRNAEARKLSESESRTPGTKGSQSTSRSGTPTPTR